MLMWWVFFKYELDWTFAADKIPYLIEENHLVEDGSLDQTVPTIASSTHSSPSSGLERIERYSRKVFVGGLPPDIDEGM